MESLFTRYRNLVVLLVVLVAQIAGLAVQVRKTGGGHNSLNAQDSSGVRLIRYWAESLVGVPERLIHNSKLGVQNIWYGYFDLRNVRQQNKDLQQTVDRLRLEQAELLEDAHQGQRLQALIGFQQHYIYSTVPAQVFGSSGSVQSKVFYIDKGSADGLKRDMSVISSEGIVGKLREVFPHTAQVLAINDQTSGAGVILETTRIRGVLKGNAAGQLEIVGLMADQRIKPGEKVLTAGGDLIFPRGLPVGTVKKVTPDPDRDSFIDIMVDPAAHLDQLDEVLVITSTAAHFPPQDQKDIVTSEALKGAQAAQIQEQMKASEIRAERLPGLNDPIAQPGQAGQPGAAGQAGVAANPAAAPPGPKLLPTLRTDRFSPNVAAGAAESDTETAPKPAAPRPNTAPAAAASGSAKSSKAAHPPAAGADRKAGKPSGQRAAQETEPQSGQGRTH